MQPPLPTATLWKSKVIIRDKYFLFLFYKYYKIIDYGRFFKILPLSPLEYLDDLSILGHLLKAIKFMEIKYNFKKKHYFGMRPLVFDVENRISIIRYWVITSLNFTLWDFAIGTLSKNTQNQMLKKFTPISRANNFNLA